MHKRQWMLLILQLLLVVTLMLYLAARSAGMAPWIFWPIVWSLLVVTFISGISFPQNLRVIPLLILAGALAIILVQVLWPQYAFGRDVAFEGQYATLLLEHGSWDPTLGMGFAENYYGYNPALHFIVALTSLVTGMEPFNLLRWFFFVATKVMIVLLAYSIIREFFEKENLIPFVATLLFIGSPGFAFLGFTRRTVAAVFILVALFALIKSFKEHSPKWDALFYVSGALAIIANHSLSFYFVIFLGAALVFSWILAFSPWTRHWIVYSALTLKVVVMAFVLFRYEVFVSFPLFQNDLQYFQEIFGSSTGTLASLFSATPATPIDIYKPYETALIFSSQGLFLVLAGLGFLLLAAPLLASPTKKRSLPRVSSQRSFLVFYALFSLAAYTLALAFLQTSLDVAVLIVIWLFAIPLSLCIAYLFHHAYTQQKTRSVMMPIITILVLIMFSGSLLMGLYTPRISNRAPTDDVVIGGDPRSKTEGLFEAGRWFGQHAPQGATLLGDSDVFEIVSGYFGHEVNPYETSMGVIYLGDERAIQRLLLRISFEFGSYAHTRHQDELDYIMMNHAFARFQSRAFGDPLPTDAIYNLEEVVALDKIYANSDAMLYDIRRERI